MLEKRFLDDLAYSNLASSYKVNFNVYINLFSIQPILCDFVNSMCFYVKKYLNLGKCNYS